MPMFYGKANCRLHNTPPKAEENRLIYFVDTFNFAIFVVFVLLYAYQFVYLFVGLFARPKQMEAKRMHAYAFVIAARNEALVLGELIKSIRAQDYPRELLEIYVVADNCTDNTADVARELGAQVLERSDSTRIGKGYALDFLFDHLRLKGELTKHDGYFIFDADNLLDGRYVAEMNKVFDNGYRILTSYRKSKNYDTNWITAGYSLWFMREAQYLNNPRMILGTGCAVSGTGFLVHSGIIDQNDGWKYMLLTEDIEFSVDSALLGEKIGYCGSAKFYDEQPYTFRQSWIQRLRWAKGFYQVCRRYGSRLVSTFVKKMRFSCYDMLMTIMPALFISLVSMLVNLVCLCMGLADLADTPEVVNNTFYAVLANIGNFYVVLYLVGLVTTLTEWDDIHAKAGKKIWYTFTFPFFMFTYIPIALAALFKKKVTWTPIRHDVVKSIEEMQHGEADEHGDPAKTGDTPQ